MIIWGVLPGLAAAASRFEYQAATNRIACVVGHILRPAPHTGLAYKRSRESPWSAWFWCISPKSSWLPRVLSVCVCGPISGCPPDLTSPPPVMQPLAAADRHAGGAFNSALGGRNDGQARSMGPQTDVRTRLGRYLCVGSVQRGGIYCCSCHLRAIFSIGCMLGADVTLCGVDTDVAAPILAEHVPFVTYRSLGDAVSTL